MFALAAAVLRTPLTVSAARSLFDTLWPRIVLAEGHGSIRKLVVEAGRQYVGITFTQKDFRAALSALPRLTTLEVCQTMIA